LGSSLTIFLLPFPAPGLPLNLSLVALGTVVLPVAAPVPGAPTLLILRRFFLFELADLSSFFLSSIFFLGLLNCERSIFSPAIFGPESFWYCVFNFSSSTGSSSFLGSSFFEGSFVTSTVVGFSSL